MSKRRDQQAADLGVQTVGYIRMPINGLMQEALETLDGLKHPHRRRGAKKDNTWLHLVFEEALLACADFAEAYGGVPWQPRFEIAAGAESARRPERIRTRESIQRVLDAAAASSP